jgi:hypothetical protein
MCQNVGYPIVSIPEVPKKEAKNHLISQLIRGMLNDQSIHVPENMNGIERKQVFRFAPIEQFAGYTGQIRKCQSLSPHPGQICPGSSPRCI